MQLASTVLVLGLGKTGVSVAQFLYERSVEYIVFNDTPPSTEMTNQLPEGSVVLTPSTIEMDQDIDWATISMVVQSPGIPYTLPKPHPITALAKAKGISVVCDIDLFAAFKPPHIACVGVTGTNGKSTTTALLNHLFNTHLLLKEKPLPTKSKAYMGGNIGIPALDLLKEKDAAYYVLELSSYQLEILNSIDLNAAILLNITPDHLDRHGTMQAYAAVKEKIFTSTAHAFRGDHLPPFVTVETLPTLTSLRGEHNVQNVNAAAAVATALNVPKDHILQALKTFVGLPHRMETVYEDDDLLIVNDSKATNAEAAERALQSYLAYAKNLASISLIGEACEPFYNDLIKEVPAQKLHQCITLEKAIDTAVKQVNQQRQATGRFAEKQVILFSPACASFDQFKNFEHRGDVFKLLIKEKLLSTKTIAYDTVS